MGAWILRCTWERTAFIGKHQQLHPGNAQAARDLLSSAIHIRLHQQELRCERRSSWRLKANRPQTEDKFFSQSLYSFHGQFTGKDPPPCYIYAAIIVYLVASFLMEKEVKVIVLTRSNGAKFYINPELIQTVESTPDTVITLVNSKKLLVKDTPQEISERFIEYRRKTLAPFISQEPGE